MAREIVEIVITEKGGKATSSSIKRVGKTSGSVRKKILGLVAALGILAGIRGFLGVAKAAIDTSAAFEQYGVRLAGLLGDQREANKALETFTKLASKTPFAVSEIVEGASTLASAALGNRERLEELTETAANLAAVTGLSFQDAAGNLQRSLAAGIASADLFRERGVKALIESIAGIPDATKLSMAELEVAFAQTFGAGGTFGKAAEDLSKTLGGALSNVGDATTNVSKALGDAFRGPVINSLRDVLLPFLGDLQKIIEENEDAITDFARDGLNVAIQLFGLLTLAAVEALRVLNKLRGVGTVFQGIIGEEELSRARGHVERLESMRRAAEGRGDQPLVENLTGRIGEARAELSALQVTVGGLADEFRLGEEEAAKFESTLDSIKQRAAGVIAGGAIGSAAPKVDTKVDLPVGESREAIEAQAKAAEKLLELNEKINLSALRRKDKYEAEIFLLGQQANELIATAQAAGNVEAALDGVKKIQEEILLVQKAQTEAQEKADAKTNATARKLGETLSDSLEDAIGGGLRAAITGEGFDMMELLADTAGQLLKDSMDDVMNTLGKQFKELLGGEKGILGKDGLLGGELGKSLGRGWTAGLGAAMSILPGALRDTEADVTNSLVRSAANATQAEAQRGVIAGDSSLPIFQVGQTLEAALVGTEGKLDVNNEFQALILDAIRSISGGVAAGGSVGESAAETLSQSSALLA